MQKKLLLVCEYGSRSELGLYDYENQGLRSKAPPPERCFMGVDWKSSRDFGLIAEGSLLLTAGLEPATFA